MNGYQWCALLALLVFYGVVMFRLGVIHERETFSRYRMGLLPKKGRD